MTGETSAARTRMLNRDARTLWVHQDVALRVHEGAQQGEIFALNAGITRLGSGPDAEIHLDDAAVSALHCEVELNESGLLVSDLASTNGTRVDGVRVEHAHLHEGARLSVGQTVLSVELGEAETEVALSHRTNFGGLLGHSPVMRSVFATLEQVAKTDATLLLHGESGTGKEVAARALHTQGPRRDGPFVVFDCGAAPENLIESLLFGHHKGAFTGATEARTGVFEEAHGGTLMLDEIGELPLLLQPKLLRALETKTIQRLGESKERACDVRIVAATNRNLNHEVRAANFREDLFYRLSVISLRLPALRERREEIPRLAAHFLSQLRGDDAPELSQETIELLRAHAWPGNVRELRNVVERLVTLPHLSASEAIGSELGAPGLAQTRLPVHLPFHESKERCLETFERGYLEHWLQECDGNVSEVARSTGLARQSVHRLLKKHGLGSPH